GYSFADGESGVEQIYAAMNKAMRDRATSCEVESWVPLIYHIDCALRRIPPSRTRIYRGINVRYDEAIYGTGKTVIWDGFSSTSSDEEVAREFAGLVKDDEAPTEAATKPKEADPPRAPGTLFIIEAVCAYAVEVYSAV